MSLYVLDTDTLTLHQEGHAKVRERAGAVPPAEIAVSVLSVEEQLSGWYTQLRQAKKPDRLVWAYRRLAQNVRFLSRLTIPDFDEAAIARFENLRLQKLKIGKTDLQIAAVALQNEAILVTANTSDFKRIPGLRIEDWSKQTSTAPATAFAEGSLIRSPTEMYRGYGVGRILKIRGEQAKVDYNPSLFKPPAIASLCSLSASILPPAIS
jgi:tRNA(fMet)-specific endonuclease VapC